MELFPLPGKQFLHQKGKSTENIMMCHFSLIHYFKWALAINRNCILKMSYQPVCIHNGWYQHYILLSWYMLIYYTGTPCIYRAWDSFHWLVDERKLWKERRKFFLLIMKLSHSVDSTLKLWIVWCGIAYLQKACLYHCDNRVQRNKGTLALIS